jgi:hypothetical protein
LCPAIDVVADIDGGGPGQWFAVMEYGGLDHRRPRHFEYIHVDGRFRRRLGAVDGVPDFSPPDDAPSMFSVSWLMRSKK